MKFQFLFICLCVICFSGCSTRLKTNSQETATSSVNGMTAVSDQHTNNPDGIKPDKNLTLPRVDLNQDLLEQLLIMNFAPYSSDFKLSAHEAFKAAQASQDYRLASYAAITALRVRDYAMAKKAAEIWLSLIEKQKAARQPTMTLILAELGLGDASAAYQLFQEYFEPNDLAIHLDSVVQILVGQRNAQAAVETIEMYAQHYPASRDAVLSIAYVAGQFERYELAEHWLEVALDMSSGWDKAAQLKADILLRQNKLEQRSDFIDQFLQRFPKSIFMRINQSVELAKQDKYDQALELMRGVVGDDPENISALNYAAALAEHLEKKTLAKEFYVRILAKQANGNDEVYWSLARLAVQDKAYREAEKYYQEISDERMYLRAQLQVANMRYETRGLKAALSVLNDVEPITEQDYVDLANTRHYLLMRDYQYEEAFAAINETMIYLPNNLELRYARSLVAAELEEVETVEEDLRFVIARQPQNAEALNALGYTLADQTGRLEEAKELIEQALTLMPDAPHIIDSLGWVLYRLGDLNGAQKYLEQALEKSAIAEIAAHLGEVYWEQGQQDKAKSSWEKGLEDDAKNPVLQETMRRYGVDAEDL